MTSSESVQLFSDLPDEANVWIYAASEPIRADVAEVFLDALKPFFLSWTSHERPVIASAVLREDRFLIIAAHVPTGDLSGCGIDKSVGAVRNLATAHGIEWIGALDVLLRDPSGNIVLTSRAELRSSASSEALDERCSLFDLNVITVGQLRLRGIELPITESWFGSAVPV